MIGPVCARALPNGSYGPPQCGHDTCHTIVGVCSCPRNGVTGIDRLADLMAAGIDQLTASRWLWGGGAGFADYARTIADTAAAWGDVRRLLDGTTLA